MAQGIYYTLGLKTSGFTNPLKGAMQGVGALKSGMAGLASSALAVAGPLIGVASAVAAVGKAFSAAADRESLSSSFRVMIGNAEEAADVMARLKQFANTTPFEMTEIGAAAKALLAFGSRTETLTDELRALGDVASGLNVPLGDMVTIYGKARAQTTLYTEDIMQLAERGVPAFDALAKVLGVSQGEVKKLASEGKITFPYLVQIMSDLTAKGGKFHGMMAEQSKTTAGMLSTLKDAVHELFVAFGTPFNDALKPIMADLTKYVAEIEPQIASFGATAGKAIQGIYGAFKTGKIGEAVGLALKIAASEMLNFLAAGFQALAPTLAKVLGEAIQQEFPRMSKLMGGGGGAGDGKSFADRFAEARTNPLAPTDKLREQLDALFKEVVEAGKGVAEATATVAEEGKTFAEKMGTEAPKIAPSEPKEKETKPAPGPAVYSGVEDDGRRRRSRLRSAEESAMARYQRMSKADRDKLGGQGLEGFLGISPSQIAALQGLAPGRFAATFNSGTLEIADALKNRPAEERARRAARGGGLGGEPVGRSREERAAEKGAKAFAAASGSDKTNMLLAEILKFFTTQIARA